MARRRHNPWSLFSEPPVERRVERRVERKAHVTVLNDGESEHYSVLTFFRGSTAGRRRVESASAAMRVARDAADDLLRRGLVEEVRLSLAVGRRETGIEIRRARDGRIEVSPWHLAPRLNPSSATPPVAVQRAFARGLELHARGLGGDGLRPETVTWARRLAKGEAITPAKARKMAAWFARHGVSPREVSARLRQAREIERGTHRGRAPALVAWLLWGGDPAVAWSRELVESGWAHEDVPLPRKRLARGNPARLERCVERVERRLREESADPIETRSRSWAICTAALQRSGYLVPGTRTTTRGALLRAKRRRERRAKGR